ncbi:hypothetical protein BOX15_Mlig028892g3, partial [Macrostomum lignano]
LPDKQRLCKLASDQTLRISFFFKVGAGEINSEHFFALERAHALHKKVLAEDFYRCNQPVKAGKNMGSNGTSDREDLSSCDAEEASDAFDDPGVEETKIEFGVLFDIDGVIALGLNPLPQAREAIRMLICPETGRPRVPFAFVTNGCALGDSKAKKLSQWFDVQVSPDQCIHSQSPLSVFTKWHHKRVLFVGQGPILEIAESLGFTNVCELEDVKKAYPLLDMVDHNNRKSVANGYVENPDFPRIECIISIGEPDRWESYLQLIIDLLVTNGKPDKAPERYPDTHLPILACNMDLVFKAEACMPRFGHGSFLLCLEALYEKITGNALQYTHLIGKPSEITYRFSEHTIAKLAMQIPGAGPIKRIYFVGDNPEVDIKGANLYNKYLGRYRRLSGSLSGPPTIEQIRAIRRQIDISKSRMIPDDAEFMEHSAKLFISILVGTGVYNPSATSMCGPHVYHGHRDIERDDELTKPHFYFDDCHKAVQFIFSKEKFK